MAQCRDELIESWVYTRSTYVLYLRLWIERYRYALADLLFCLGNELYLVVRNNVGESNMYN